MHHQEKMRLVLFVLLALGSLFAQSNAVCILSGGSPSVYEEAPTGSVVDYGTYDNSATVGTVFTLSLDAALDRFFYLDGVTLKVKSNISRNDATSGSNIIGSITCVVTGSGVNIPNTLYIQIIKINKTPPKFDSSSYTFSVDDNYPLDVDIPFARVFATDKEVDTNLMYNIESQSPENVFKLASTSLPQFQLIATLEYNRESNYIINVSATSTGVDNIGNYWLQISYVFVVFNVMDTDNNPPVFFPCLTLSCPPPLYQATVENGSTELMFLDSNLIQARDGDTQINAQIFYLFVSGYPSNYAEYFEIDLLTAAVTMIMPFNGNNEVFTLLVRATENSDLGLSSYATLTVRNVQITCFPCLISNGTPVSPTTKENITSEPTGYSDAVVYGIVGGWIGSLVVIVVLGWFFIARPHLKQEKEKQYQEASSGAKTQDHVSGTQHNMHRIQNNHYQRPVNEETNGIYQITVNDPIYEEEPEFAAYYENTIGQDA